jgi:hypothetical protein
MLSNDILEHLVEGVKKTHYYYLNKYNPYLLQHLCSSEHLDETKHILHIYANDYALELKDRNRFLFDLGNYYFIKENEEDHLQKAFHCYRNAAVNGNPQASIEVGHYHKMGLGGMEVNHDVAMDWYKFASEQTQDITILLCVAENLERMDVEYALSLYKHCASTTLGLLFLIDFHERIGVEEDLQIAEYLRVLLPDEYKSCRASEKARELYLYEVAKRDGIEPGL